MPQWWKCKSIPIHITIWNVPESFQIHKSICNGWEYSIQLSSQLHLQPWVCSCWRQQLHVPSRCNLDWRAPDCEKLIINTDIVLSWVTNYLPITLTSTVCSFKCRQWCSRNMCKRKPVGHSCGYFSCASATVGQLWLFVIHIRMNSRYCAFIAGVVQEVP